MKKGIIAILFLLIFLVLTVGCASPADGEQRVFGSGDLNIHFLELGNKYTGDSVYINYGDIDIIIDAGSKQSSAATIRAYIDNHIQDGKIEYVIATHAHEDHIAGFYTTTTTAGIFDSYEIDIIIDFPMTNSTTATYNNYKRDRDRAVARGAAHYTALECYNNEGAAQRVWNLGGGVELEILYNYYYENYTSIENNYSVAVRINQDGRQYLFTGDLERDGEERLVDFYADNFGGLGRCTLYKGGHHGSRTSSNVKLMEAIRPEYVCVCSCTGSSEYNANPQNVFPSQDFINRVAPYTDRVYVTTLVTDYAGNQFEPLNGNIIFSVSQGNISVAGSNNSLKLKDTPWFMENRNMPADWR
ncbi:MAG: MBL fold metallo-hydrolase [Treponema sp.]|nr:MBL fold metallo-hydrolase [Treponema sp.]